MSFLDFWSVLRSRSEQTELKLSPQHLERLLSDNGIRSALRCDSVLSLLPPAGSAVFRRFTAQSMKDIQHQAKETGTEMPKPSYHLEAEKPLPFFYKDPPPEILYTPLEELDPFYKSEKTFLVLSRGNVLHRFNAESSCFILSPLSRLRTASIKVLLHPFLSWFMLATLLTNCVFMVLENTAVSYAMQCVFSVIYTCEALVKVFSRGFCAARFTFIRDPWNWLDLIVIITAFPALIVEMGEFYVLVTIPRVLKIFSVFLGLRRTVQALLQVVKKLANVLLVTVFCLSMLAAISMVFFMGSLRNKCVFWPMNNSYYGNQTNTDVNDTFYYHSYVNDPGNHYIHSRSIDPLVCGNVSSAGVCPSDSMCLRSEKTPNYGYTSYGWFAPSLLSMFRLLTQDFTDNLLQLTIRANGYFIVLAFVLLFLPTCFMLLSQVVAAVAMALVQQEESDFAQRTETKEVFKQIEELLKSREDTEESSSGAVLTEKKQSSEEEAISIKETDEAPKPSSCWHRLQRRFRAFILSSVFEWAIIICLIINTIIMATEHTPLSYEYNDFLAVAEIVFKLVFMVEMVLKLLALGIRGYFRVSWHIYDFILVLLSLVELFLDGISGMSALQFSGLRILRLARWWPGLHLFLRVVWSSVQHLTLVLLVLVFLFVVVGLQLFRRDYTENVCHISQDCELPRWHMSDLFHTFMMVCRILFGQWIETLWDCMMVSNTGLCVLYFILVLVLGKLLLLVLFLHLLLSSITNQRLSSVEEKDKKSLETLKQLCRRTGTKDRADNTKGRKKESLTLNLVGTEVQTSEDRTETQGDEPQGTEPEDCCCNCCIHCCPFQDLDSSRGLGKVWSNLRRNSLKVVQNKIFEGFVIFIILLSSAALMLEDNNLQHSPVLMDVLDWADRVFILFFVMEMILQWLALGLHQYFTNAWRWIDFIVLDVSLVSLVLDVLGVSCRPMRVFRTLRTLSRFKGVKLVLHTLVLALPRLLKSLLVILLVWLLWALLGIRLFGGKFWFCLNMTSEELPHHSEVENKTSCFMLMIEDNQSEITWINTYFHFDHVPMSYLSLSLLAMSRGWLDILYSAMDSTQIEQQVQYESNIYSFFYFLGFFIVGVFFTFNFFVRIFIHTIHQHRHKFGGKHVFMTEEQQMFPEGFKKRFSVKPENHVPRPQNRFQAWIFDLVLLEVFEVFMMVVVVLNLVLVMVETYDDSIMKWKLQHWFHVILILIFLLEFLLKIIALRRFYFNCLNVVDLLVLLTSIGGLFLSDLYFIHPYFFLFLRLARLGRVLRFFRCARGIRMLFLGFMMSLPALLNVGLLLLIIFYTFSVLGAMSFGEVNMGDMFNFHTFWQSMVCMTMVTTSSSWDGFLIPIMRPPECNTDAEPVDCGSPVGGPLFFVSYLVLLQLLVLLLFIAVIQQIFNAHEELWEFQEEHLTVFVETWKKVDNENTGSIPHSALWELCQALQDALRVPAVNLFTLIDTKLQGDQLQCEDVLQTLTQQVFGISLPNEKLRESVKGIFPQEEEGNGGEEVGEAKGVGLA
ncbi:sodium channel protein type 4 subunit alpha A-like isoform X2 [Gouania willdenowi]|uniref:sodium channel protein type 4 subunit alpha A-like isoform X2 n=1 Tax=Gouania willdenowi TaxID=441366 RepID=UPI0010566C2C|nr:sodium channel protein type 4 subunit alpha A-like isoform X2 [Gouania willdenowi]